MSIRKGFEPAQKKRPHSGRSESKEFGVAAKTGERENQCVLANLVDEQPVWGDVTFAMMAIPARQRVVAVMSRQRLTSYKCVDDVGEEVEVAALFDGGFQILFELRGLFKEALINSAAPS